MFQIEFNEEKKYQNYNKKAGIKPSEIIPLKAIRMMNWEEHCVECGAPLCYNACQYYKSNGVNNKCRRFKFGYCYNEEASDLKNNIHSVDVTFGKWAKMESEIFKNTFTPKKIAEITKNFDFWEKLDVLFYKLFTRKFIDQDKYNLRHVLGKRKKLKKLKSDIKVNASTFLFQAYSHSKINFKLFIEIFSDEQTIYRNNLNIAPGYNKHIVEIPKEILDNGGLFRIYAEDNLDEEPYLTIYNCNLVELNRQKVKCVVWDLDNTLWDGILIESNPKKLKLQKGVLEAIKELDEHGILQSIASKNTESEVMPVLKRLKVDKYFLFPQINWEPKSSNIRKIANALNINLDTFLFIDDSDFERREVSAILPQVRVHDEKFIDKISIMPELKEKITEESKNRRELYMTELKRNQVKEAKFENNLDFLRSCNMRISIFNLEDDDLKNRAFELLQRTNQLNLSGNKYSREDFDKKLLDKTDEKIIVKCDDDFGGYGYIIFISYKIKDDILFVDEFAMSCRVAKKCVENALVQYLKNSHKNIKKIVLVGNRTEKNDLFIDTFKEMGFDIKWSGKKFNMTFDLKNKIPNNDIVKIGKK